MDKSVDSREKDGCLMFEFARLPSIKSGSLGKEFVLEANAAFPVKAGTYRDALRVLGERLIEMSKADDMVGFPHSKENPMFFLDGRFFVYPIRRVRQTEIEEFRSKDAEIDRGRTNG